jgi:hypothetical protein
MKTTFQRVQSQAKLCDNVIRALVLPIFYADQAFEQVVFTAARMPNLASSIDLDLRFPTMVIAVSGSLPRSGRCDWPAPAMSGSRHRRENHRLRKLRRRASIGVRENSE